MTTSKKRVDVIGVGFGTTVHVPAFQSEGWEVVAISSLREARAQKAAAGHGIPNAHTDYQELIARDDLDVVSITTPPGPHHEIAMAALQAGKHVLCEKPFTLNAAEATELEREAQNRGLTAMIAHEFRFAPQRAYIRDLLVDGYIGEPRMTVMELFAAPPRPGGDRPRSMSWASRTADGGGMLGALGSHYIDALRHWLGDVATVSGQVAAMNPERWDETAGKVVIADADDTFSFTLTFSRTVG